MPINQHATNVLVTRPIQQASNLCQKLDAANLNPINFPCIEIQTVAEQSVVKQQLTSLKQKDYLIFTSANAVLHADLLLSKHWPTLNNTLVAIGPKTAEALCAVGLKPSIIAQAPFNSESLLRQFPSSLQNKTCAIIKGEGGRPFLAEQLRQRGMTLSNIDVYRRSLPSYRPSPTQTLHYITITSQLALSNLFSLMKNRAGQLKQQSHFIVFSQRIADYAISLGCQHVHICHEASDDGLVRAIVEVKKANEF